MHDAGSQEDGHELRVRRPLRDAQTPRAALVDADYAAGEKGGAGSEGNS